MGLYRLIMNLRMRLTYPHAENFELILKPV